jgi:hypothetical protein
MITNKLKFLTENASHACIHEIAVEVFLHQCTFKVFVNIQILFHLRIIRQNEGRITQLVIEIAIIESNLFESFKIIACHRQLKWKI